MLVSLEYSILFLLLVVQLTLYYVFMFTKTIVHRVFNTKHKDTMDIELPVINTIYISLIVQRISTGI